MVSTKQEAVVYFLITVSSVYIWNFVFSNHDWLPLLGTSMISIVVGVFSLIWNVQASLSSRSKEKNIWILFSLGLISHITGNILWFISILQEVLEAPSASWLLWLLAYFFFLLALIYKVKVMSSVTSGNPYLFNTVVFLVMISAVLLHYLVMPLWATTANLFELIVFGLLYPLVDFSIIFVVTLLFFLSKDSKNRTVAIVFMIAFYLQVFADANAAFFKTNGSFYELILEPIWTGALLLLGFASRYARNHQQVLNRSEDTVSSYKEFTLPYLSTILLIVLVYQSYKWELNALSLGMGLVLLLIMGRHLSIMKKNNKLMVQFRELAYHDPLTQLLNRTSFKVDLQAAIERAEGGNRSFSLLLIDLDRFKMVNDTLGHLVGDLLLKETASRLTSALGIETDYRIYRLGGDEFVVLVEKSNKESVSDTANQIIRSFEPLFTIHHHEISITPSIGISTYPYHGKDNESLFKAADAAMYVAKGKGRNNYQFFNSELNESLIRKMNIENELRKAIERDELELYYQPKINLKTGELLGVEALLRWNNKELGKISPAEFIPVAEDTGLIVMIGEWVLMKACLQNQTWQSKGYKPFSISVNVSVQQFKFSNLVHAVSRSLGESGMKAEYLELEITESIMQNIEESKQILSQIKDLGVKISLDDFGTGYSSLHVLKCLAIHTLKIDKAFVDDINLEHQSMVKGIIDIASNLGLTVIAEGVEHEEQVRALLSYQCEQGQGYLFSKPVPAREFEKLFLEL